jgi:hypothetical protein
VSDDQDARARKLRAEKLRKQIRQITGAEPPEKEDSDEDPGPRKKSPHELIEEKMRELDAERSKRKT